MRKAGKIAKFAAFGIAAVGIAGWVAMSLWNLLMPEIFGVHAIGFWQALGLLVLSRLFFGGFHGRGGHRGRWMRRRWENMTPGDREKFREAMRQRCGGFGKPAADA
jgi:hypothetical protein